jgi:metal-sulfur cluster biosynthetic enzyme
MMTPHEQPPASHGAVNTLVTDVQVREVLKQVEDPELHIDIVTLELVYGIVITDGNVVITMTLTTPACPYGPMLIEMVKLAVRKIPGVTNVDVKVTFDPVWQPSDDLKAMMGLL